VNGDLAVVPINDLTDNREAEANMLPLTRP
jgi:hypothetical protein